jgi:hypothetical protein
MSSGNHSAHTCKIKDLDNTAMIVNEDDVWVLQNKLLVF